MEWTAQRMLVDRKWADVYDIARRSVVSAEREWKHMPPVYQAVVSVLARGVGLTKHDMQQLGLSTKAPSVMGNIKRYLGRDFESYADVKQTEGAGRRPHRYYLKEFFPYVHTDSDPAEHDPASSQAGQDDHSDEGVHCLRRVPTKRSDT